MGTAVESPSTPAATIHALLAPRPGDDRWKRVAELVSVHAGGVDDPAAGAVRAALGAIDAAAFERCFAEMLDVRPLALLARAWAQFSEVRAAVERSLRPGAPPQSVSLPSHTVEARLEPRLVLAAGGVDWCDVRFEVTLAVTVTSAVLDLRAGALAAVRLADALARLTLACEGTPLHAFAREVHLVPLCVLDTPLDLAALARA